MEAFAKKQIAPRQTDAGLYVVRRVVIVAVASVFVTRGGIGQGVEVKAVCPLPAGANFGGEFHAPAREGHMEKKL